MSNFAGVTFAEQIVTPSDDGIVRNAILSDGVLTGCGFSYSGATLTMAAGSLMLYGRQIRHTAASSWPVVDAVSGYARLVLTIDLTQASTVDDFNQISTEVQYATALDGFSSLQQTDINAAGTKYQAVLCVVSLGTGGITGVVSTLPVSAPRTASAVYASATGTASSLALAKDTITTVPLGTWKTRSSESFVFSADGGLVMPEDGVVMVFSAVYFNTSSPSKPEELGVYFKKNGEEITGQKAYCVGQTAVHVSPVTLEVEKGDVLTLCARNVTNAGSCIPNSKHTALTVYYLTSGGNVFFAGGTGGDADDGITVLPTPPTLTSSRIVLVVDMRSGTPVWDQTYSLEEMIAAAKNGMLECYAGDNSDGDPAGEIDGYAPCTLPTYTLESSKQGGRISFVNQFYGYEFRWNSDGFAYTFVGDDSDQGGGGLSTTAANLLITILRNGVYSTDQSANITSLEALLNSSGSGGGSGSGDSGGDDGTDTEKTLTGISATYTGGSVAVGTAVSALTDIVVTAHYSDGTSNTVTGYTLSGEIAEGSNTITVSYGGKTTTFTVTGVAEETSAWKDGYFKTDGSIAQSEGFMYCEEYFPVTPGQTYYLSNSNPAWRCTEANFAYYDANKNFVSRNQPAASTFPMEGLIVPTTAPDNAAFVRVSANVKNYEGTAIVTQDPPELVLPFEDTVWSVGYVGGQGQITADATYRVSFFVNVDAGAKYKFGNSVDGWTSSWYGIGFYTETGTFITRLTTAEFTVPDNAKYARLSAELTDDECATATLTKVS